MNEIKIHHQRLRRARGPASAFTCVACDRPAYEWAYQHGDPAPLFSPRGEAYSLDFDDYAPMCRSCHRRLDFQMSARQRAASPSYCARKGITLRTSGQLIDQLHPGVLPD